MINKGKTSDEIGHIDTGGRNTIIFRPLSLVLAGLATKFTPVLGGSSGE